MIKTFCLLLLLTWDGELPFELTALTTKESPRPGKPLCSHMTGIRDASGAPAHDTILLYGGKPPGMLPAAPATRENIRMDEIVGLLVSKITQPSLEVFVPEKPNGTAVIICPGGGYGVLLLGREGRDVARAFAQRGVTAFVLKYRLPDAGLMKTPALAPLGDAQEAIRTVRSRAAEWSVDTARIGIMGFSAGGHLAATAGTHFPEAVVDNPANTNLRPDFLLLVNPVVSFTDSIGHAGSRKNLLGNTPSREDVLRFSNELQVNGRTPPAFLVHAGDDTVVSEQNSIRFYLALRAHGVPASLHIYQRGEHGFLKEPAFDEWFGRCLLWMRQAGWTP